PNSPTASREPTAFSKVFLVIKVTSDPIDETLRINCMVKYSDAAFSGEDACGRGKSEGRQRRNFCGVSGLMYTSCQTTFYFARLYRAARSMPLRRMNTGEEQTNAFF